MSTQRGNCQRKRPQKHKNVRAFKNSMHDTTNLTQMLNNLEIYGVCARCKDQIDWKIKYKKYKPLAAPKKCVKCDQKTVKRAYTAACEPCGAKLKLCVKCLQPKELVEKSTLTQEEENQRKQELEAELRVLPERKRRAFERNLRDGKLPEGAADESEESEDEVDQSHGHAEHEDECDDEDEEAGSLTELLTDTKKVTAD